MKCRFTVLIVSLIMLQLCGSLCALPVTEQDAIMVVTGWLKADSEPMDTALGRDVMRVETFSNGYGEPVYYIVYLEPSGFVIVSADDLVEPIIGFVDDGIYDSSDENPLGALVRRDLNGRIEAVRSNVSLLSEGTEATATKTQKKWSFLKGLAMSSEDEVRLMGRSSISDVRVAPLVQTKWSQKYVYQDDSSGSGRRLCYNYYTPNNYPCGCVATAMAQVIFYHRHPTEGIGVNEFDITVDDEPEQAFTRGGDGDGGPYNWDDMVLDPNYDTPDEQRSAIGALCYDSGVSAHIDYGDSGSSTSITNAQEALLDTFSYSNAIYGYSGGINIGPGLIGMINPNLDAERPVILSVWQDTGGTHALICDGYGYIASTMYHHINVGWGGHDDAWYNLPDIELQDNYEYNSVYTCLYNVFTAGTGEIISGRATDSSGRPLDNCVLTAEHVDGETFTATTNSKGIYALVGVPSDSMYTIRAAKSGYDFDARTVVTSRSEDQQAFSGNRWGVDFPYFPPGSIIYVDEDATSGANNGTSWANAFTDLQDAIELAANLPEDIDEIWVAEGTYTPDRGTGYRSLSFQLVNGVGIYGGFEGGETRRQLRNPEINETILSGDLDGDDRSDFANREENSFHVVTGGGTDRAAIIDGFTITGGNAEGGSIKGFGAGMCIYRGSPTINDCKFIDNRADEGGGGMYNGHSEPIVTNCTFIMNEAGWGGGMYNGENSNLTLENCTFSGNSATSSGGGIRNSESSPTLVNCTFRENSTTSTTSCGGGMYNRYNSNPTLTNCTFSENSATFEGGGMCNWNNSNPTLENCTFRENSAGYGGGMSNYESSPTLTGCAFSKNSARCGGGMLSNIDSSTMLTGCNFYDNAADTGGGMCNWNNSNSEIIGCTFSENSAADEGGGMYNNLCELIVTNCMFNENSALRGGGMRNSNVCSPVITDCNFVDNAAEYGGGMENSNNVSPILEDCTFSWNEAEYGAGVYNEDNSSPTLTGCTFEDNSGYIGGGMHNFESSPTVTGCAFSRNSAEHGGGIRNNESTLTMDNCVFSGNYAEYGGGMRSNESDSTLLNCLFAKNTARYGGGLFCDRNSTSVLTNCSIVDNQVVSLGGAVYNWNDSGTTLTSCIVWNNSSEQIVNYDGGRATVTYSDVQGGWPGQGNIDDDPLFADPPNGDYHLKSRSGRWDLFGQEWVRDSESSPCIDAGDPSTTSFLIEPVPNGGRVNMGAYGGTAEASKRP